MIVTVLEPLWHSESSPWPNWEGHKGQHQTHPRFAYQVHVWEWKQLWYFFRSYCIQKQSWPWPNWQGHQGHRQVKVKLIWHFVLSTTSVKFESDCDISWRDIVFWSKVNLGPIGKVTEVTERSWWNSSKLLTSETPLWSLKAMSIFLEELSCSQVKLTLTQLTRSQGSQKGQDRTHPRFWPQ